MIVTCSEEVRRGRKMDSPRSLRNSSLTAFPDFRAKFTFCIAVEVRWGAFLTFIFHPVCSIAFPRSNPPSCERTFGLPTSAVTSPSASSKK